MSSSQEYTSTTNGILITVLISPKHVLIAGIYFYYEWYTYNGTNISQTFPRPPQEYTTTTNGILTTVLMSQTPPHRRNIQLLRMIYLKVPCVPK